jgi:hypothetical protein
MEQKIIYVHKFITLKLEHSGLSWRSIGVANVSEEPAAYILRVEVILSMEAGGSSEMLITTENTRFHNQEDWKLIFAAVKTPDLKCKMLLFTGWMQ